MKIEIIVSVALAMLLLACNKSEIDPKQAFSGCLVDSTSWIQTDGKNPKETIKYFYDNDKNLVKEESVNPTYNTTFKYENNKLINVEYSTGTNYQFTYYENGLVKVVTTSYTFDTNQVTNRTYFYNEDKSISEVTWGDFLKKVYFYKDNKLSTILNLSPVAPFDTTDFDKYYYDGDNLIKSEHYAVWNHKSYLIYKSEFSDFDSKIYANGLNFYGFFSYQAGINPISFPIPKFLPKKEKYTFYQYNQETNELLYSAVNNRISEYTYNEKGYVTKTKRTSDLESDENIESFNFYTCID